MEKVSGIQLQDVWEKMSIMDRLQIVKEIARYQRTWTSVRFNRIGGLYYREDLNPSSPSLQYTNAQGETVKDCRFTVGPATDPSFLTHGRSRLDFDRGPCKVDCQLPEMM